MLSKAFFRDNVKFVLLDDNDESSSDAKFFSNENCYIEVRLKKAILQDLLDYASSILNDSSTPINDIYMTEREIEVLKYLCEGLNNQQISELLHISIHTTKAHIHSIFTKLCVQGRTQAAVKAIKTHLIGL